MKKQSVANSASPKPLEKELTFFLDRQLGRYKMAGILRAADLKVEIHDDHFASDAKDEEWLRVTGEKEWIVITRDERIRYRAAAMQVIRRAKVRMFVLVVHGNLRIEMLAELFLKALPRIRSLAASQRPPFMAKIWRNGNVALIS